MTAAESTAAQRRVAGALAEAGLGRGDRIVLSLPGSPGYVSAVLGATRSGVVPVPLDPRLTAYEFTRIVDGASGVASDPEQPGLSTQIQSASAII